MRVFALDECDVCAEDICGYGWGDRLERREVEVDNYRDSQTYYGALDCQSEEVILSAYQTANTEATIDFVKHLRIQSEEAKIVLIWDGSSYHRSQEFRKFLATINTQTNITVHCLRFGPYAPSENPIENIWGQAKKLLRQLHQRCRSFAITKKIFELFIKYRLFSVPNLSKYQAFSSII
ncbi:transposase [Okeania sp. SIO2C2]|uniref:transposase n=1 Tax=Okeania sp. SIO2C2 TaxID=2607787 RepID=UPI00257C3F54|nr:transposase [Okeania sp. SIO2C2]